MRAFALFSLFLLPLADSFSQVNQIENLQKIVKTDKEDTNKVRHLNTLTYKLRESGHTKEAIAAGMQSAELAQKINYPRGLAGAYNNIAGIYYVHTDFKLALEYYNKSLKVCEDNKYTSFIDKIMLNMANIYSQQGDFPKALEIDLKSLEAAEKIKDTKKIAGIANDIGYIYALDNNCPLALEYYFKAIKLDSILKDSIAAAINFGNVADIYERMGKYKLAEEFDNKALNIFDKNLNKRYYSIVLASLGKIYDDEGKYSEAIDYYTKSLTLQYEAGERLGEANNYSYIGDVYIKQKKYGPAENYILKGLKIADSLSNFQLMEDCNENLIKIYRQTGQWQKAFEASEKMNKAKDTLFNDEKSKQVGRMEAKYEYDRDSAIQQAAFANQLAIKQSEAERKAAESRTQKIITGLIAFGALILILLIFQRLKGVEKEKLIAERQKSWLELKALRTQMNPHFLYNTINSIQSFILEHDTKSSTKYLSKFAILIRGVLENSRKDNITLEEEMDGLTNYIDFEAMRFPDKFTYRIEVDDRLVKTVNLLPPLLIQPHVENAIWHGLMHKENGPVN